MKYDFECSSCGKFAQIPKNIALSLSDKEKAICVKEGLDINGIVKITCPTCGVSTLTKPKISQPTFSNNEEALNFIMNNVGVDRFKTKKWWQFWK